MGRSPLKDIPIVGYEPSFDRSWSSTISISQKLKDIIMSNNRVLGSTQSGRDWCIKALHPSDPLTEVAGIPDESAVPSMFMNYQTVATVKPRTGAVGTWSADGQLIPNPLSFGAMTYEDSTTPTAANVEFLNSQLPGGTHEARLTAFLRDYTRWRLAYASVTIYQDGPALSDQGTVVVCQKPVTPRRFNVQGCVVNNSWVCATQHATHMEYADLPHYTSSQAMPNAYFGKSKEGVYIPLKLTRTHQQWHSARDLTYQANFSSLNVGGSMPGGLTIPTTDSGELRGLYPFLSMNDFHYSAFGEGPTINSFGELTSDFCNDIWADFSFRNMSVDTSLSLFFRFGFEMQLQPTSMLSPHLKLSPPSDKQAIEAYFAVSRELKDAYPADYNDLGKIWGVISSIVRAIAPGLAYVPLVGPALPALAHGAVRLGDRIVSAVQRAKKPNLGSVASAADIQRIRNARDAMPPPRQTSAHRPRKPVVATVRL